jgi:hypothetical protein
MQNQARQILSRQLDPIISVILDKLLSTILRLIPKLPVDNIQIQNLRNWGHVWH